MGNHWLGYINIKWRRNILERCWRSNEMNSNSALPTDALPNFKCSTDKGNSGSMECMQCSGTLGSWRSLSPVCRDDFFFHFSQVLMPEIVNSFLLWKVGTAISPLDKSWLKDSVSTFLATRFNKNDTTTWSHLWNVISLTASYIRKLPG